MSPVLAAGALAASNGHLSTGEGVIFWILAPIAVLCAVGLVLARNAIHAALLLVVVMFCLAVFYVANGAPFLGAVQVIVYAGAIMILFLFVLMLIGRDSSDSLVETLKGQRLIAFLIGLAFACIVAAGIGSAVRHTSVSPMSSLNSEDNIAGIARIMFTDYVFAFEATSALLITAAVGAMVLAHRERAARPTQRELVQRRFEGRHPTPLPPPGVFARHDAVDVAALLPDGSRAPTSLMPEYAGGPAPDPESPRRHRDDISGPAIGGGAPPASRHAEEEL